MRRTFSNIPYTIFEPREKDEAAETERAYIERLEGFYHSVILTMLWAACMNVKAEELKYRSDGVYCSQNKLPSNSVLGITSDLILEYEEDVYIIELKKQPPEVSLKQIREKEYGLKYGDRQLFLVGIEIDDEKRNISGYKLEKQVIMSE